MIKVREDDHRVIKAFVRKNMDNETEVWCHSSAKEIKEKGINTLFQNRFEEKLAIIQRALPKKHGTKKYEKVVERIGRLKEKYRRIARRYDIRIEKDETTGNAVNLFWWRKQIDDTSGYYILRTSCTDFSEKEIFDMFTMLLDVEDAFRSMKSELGLRPVRHHIEFRCDGHLFITVLAYHVLHAIRLKLKRHGITHSWSTIRDILSTQYRITTSMCRADGKMIYIRKTSKPEDCHKKIYDALGFPHRPGKISKTIL